MYGWMWTYSNGWLPRPTKSTERALTCQTSHTHVFAQGRIISQGGGGRDAPSIATRGYPRFAAESGVWQSQAGERRVATWKSDSRQLSLLDL